jgi:hypothetical protein
VHQPRENCKPMDMDNGQFLDSQCYQSLPQ